MALNTLRRPIIKCETKTDFKLYSDSLTVADLDADEYVTIEIVLGGNGICCAFSETLEFKTGDVFVFDSGIPHSCFALSAAQGPRILSVSFHPNTLDGPSSILLERIFKDGIPYSCSVLNASAMSEICAICGHIRRETENKELDWTCATTSYLSLLLITLGRYIDLADTLPRQRPKEWATVFAAMGEVMRSFSDHSLTLGSVADKLYISRSHLSRVFLNATGESFPDYVRKMRLKRACALLESTQMSNEDIVYECGMKDIQSFYRAFKAFTGMTPKEYKKEHANRYLSINGDIKMITITEISQAVQSGRAKNVKAVVDQAISEGLSAETILNEGLIGGMSVIGEKFKNNEVYVPEVLMAARAMNTGLESLRPLLGIDNLSAKGRVCIGTVLGDLHDIGKNLVKIMMESRGLEVIDLGTDVPPERFISTAIEENCQVICLSALLTTTMPVMAEVVKAAEAAGIRDRIKIMVGGAPVNEKFCSEIGADKYTADAATAAKAAVEFCAAMS